MTSDLTGIAVSLAKLSVWLVTLARDHAFTFLDHALKHGDSLLGLTPGQIERFHWQPDVDVGPLFAGVRSSAAKAASLRARIGSDHEGHEDQQKADLREADDEVRAARRVGDMVLYAFLSREKPKERELLLALLRERLKRGVDGDELEFKLLDDELDQRKRGDPPFIPFHWQLEFPEVFEEERGGFDASVGNPPFMGGSRISASHSGSYRDWLLTTHEESHGNADLVAHFFRKAFELLRFGGCFGLIATNTIAQGDTRSTGLRFLCAHGGAVFEVRRRYIWPIPGASVIVSVIHLRKGVHDRKPILDGREVERISAFLFRKGGDEDPRRLRANEGKSFKGVFIFGMGFVFDEHGDEKESNTLSEMLRLEEESPQVRERIFPYLGGEEFNDSPTQAHRRYAINFGELSEDAARSGWPDLMTILENKVKPMRLMDKRASYRRWWWQYAEKRSELHSAIEALPNHARILACVQTSKYRSFALVPAHGMIFDQKLVVFPLEGLTAFSVLSSRVHERWALFFGSTMKDDPVYTPSDCFDPFPFPGNWKMDTTLETVGQAYDDFRATLMVENNEGLTKTYNRFHDPNEQDPRIAKLRALHDALDRAVLDAYGWTDLKPECGFELEYEIDEDEYKNRKKPWRYRWNESMRDEVLARLLALNQVRAEEERLAGVAAAGAKEETALAPGKPLVVDAPAKTTRKKKQKQAAPQPELFQTRAVEQPVRLAEVISLPKRIVARPPLPSWDINILSTAAQLAGAPLNPSGWSTALTGAQLGEAALAAVLRQLREPRPRSEVEQAVVAVALPQLQQRYLPNGVVPTWHQAVGAQNLSVRSIASLQIPWDEVVRTARAQHVLATDSYRWSAGTAVAVLANEVLDARAIVALSWLSSLADAGIDSDLNREAGALRGRLG